MADIKVVIQLQDTIEDEINSLESSTYVNNASINKTGEQFNTLSTKSAGANLKSWATGSLSLADGYVGGANTQLIEQYGYNGYVFGAVPESKQLTVNLEVVGKYIDSIIVYGDRTANQFPTKAYRDGNPNDIIYSDDPVWAIKFDQQSTSHTITFLEWNRANYNACITYVAELKNELTLDKSWIKSLESLSQSTGQPKDVYYGITPSSGQIEILDRDGEIKDYLQDGLLDPRDLEFQIDTNGYKIQKHISTNGNYSNTILNLNSTNKLDSWSNIFHKTRMLTNECSLYELLKDVLISAGVVNNENEVNSMLQNKVVFGENNQQETIEQYLKTINIPYPYLEGDYIRNTVNKICEVSQLNVIEDSDGQIQFVSARPLILVDQKPIKINDRHIFGSKEYDVIINNKYDGIECTKFNYEYGFSDSDSSYVEFMTLPSPTIINNQMYYPYNYSTFESDYKYTAKTYDNLVLMYDKAFYMDSTNGYFSVYEYLPRNNAKVKKDRHFGVNYKVSQSRSIVSANSSFYLSPFQEYEVSQSVHSSGGIFSQTEFERGITIQGGQAIINQTILADEGSKYYVFYSGGVGCYTVYDDNNNYRYYIILPTHHLYYNTQASSTEGIASKMYSLNLLIKDLRSVETEFKNGEKRLSLNRNELIQTDDIINALNNSIRQDYANGIRTMNISISCSDYFYVDGTKAKDWQSGETILVGDIVEVDGYIETWKVTGRNFRYSGVPMIDLELQEVKMI